MRINDMVRMNLQKEQVSKQSQTAKSQKGKVHLEGVDPDRDITNSTAHRRIVPVSDEVKQEIIDIMKNNFMQNNGMTDGEAKAKVINEYLETIPSKERSATAWTLNQISMDTARQLGAKIEETHPNWQPGQDFDKSVLDNFPPKHIDIKI